VKRTRAPITTAQIAEAQRLRRDGATIRETAAETGMSRSSVFRYARAGRPPGTLWCRRCGVWTRPPCIVSADHPLTSRRETAAPSDAA
jgi:hypothetical protein